MSHDRSTGRTGFAEQYGLRNKTALEAAERIVRLAQEQRLETIRLSFPDQHGQLRSKTIPAGDLAGALENGCSMTTTLLLKDSSHRTVFPVWSAAAAFDMPELQGAGDFIMLPDPATFRVLPWSERTGWLLCDIYFANGKPVPFATRDVCRRALRALAEQGYDYVAGLEVEFHVFKLDDPKLKHGQGGHPAEPPATSLLAHGYQYLTEARADELEPVLELIRATAMKLALPVRSIEVEFGPSQVEFTFHPDTGLAHADNMILFRSAVKQVCRRNGYHATFMCRPALPDLFSSGWHLHQSLNRRDSGRNAFIPETEAEIISDTGRHFVAGLLEHAAASCVFTTPTINGYKRYRRYALAPDRILWGNDNKGAMVRAIGTPGEPGSRIENRVGEPAANPYLYFASQIFAGLDGVKKGIEPPAPSVTPYDQDAPALPRSLIEAVSALRQNASFAQAMGSAFVDYIATIKEAEIARFLSEVTDWEQREYFENF